MVNEMRAATKEELYYLTETLNPAFSFATQEAKDVYELIDFLEGVDVPIELRTAVKLKISRTKNPYWNVSDTSSEEIKKTKAKEFVDSLIANS